MKPILFWIVVGLTAIAAPALADGRLQFTSGDLPTSEQFGSEGAFLLGLGAILITIVFILLWLIIRQHDQCASILDSLERKEEPHE